VPKSTSIARDVKKWTENGGVPLMAPRLALLLSAGLAAAARAPLLQSSAVVPSAFSLWRQRSYSLGSSGVAVNVTAGGAFELELVVSSGVAVRVVVASSFTEAAIGAGRVHRLTDTESASWKGLAVDRSGSSSGVWTVYASSASYKLQRRYRWERARLQVEDTLMPTAAGGEVVGIEVNHTASITGAGATEAVLGGPMMPFDCQNTATVDNWGQLGHGNPSAYMSVGQVGVGLLARDDVFALHASTRQQALARYPRMPSALPSCPTTDPPSIVLADPTFAVAANATGGGYTMRWDAIFTDDQCDGYFCFINRAREAVGVTDMLLPGTGWMSLPPDWYPSQLTQANYTADWWQWPAASMDAFLQANSNAYPVAFVATTDRNMTCNPEQRQFCYGGCMLNELSPASDTYFERFASSIANAAAASPNGFNATRGTMMYFHPYIDTETDAASKYPDSLAVDQRGAQQVYRRCAAGTDRPLFVPTHTNSYGKMLNGYVPLAMDRYKLGGIYHDEFGGSSWAYTYNLWDNHSAVLDPVNKSILALPGNLKLLSREWELGMMNDIQKRGGVLFMNGQPATDAWRHARFSYNLVEDTNAHWARWTHLYTPLQFTRNGPSVFHDGDPKCEFSVIFLLLYSYRCPDLIWLDMVWSDLTWSELI
jgi:hypothetical protein